MQAATAQRDYSSLRRALDAPRSGDAERFIVDQIWESFGGAGLGRNVSWVGVYHAAPDGASMTLTYRRDKPACSPLGLQGMCGRSMLVRKIYVVRDVATLGAGYIACDPLDKSELVLPLMDVEGGCSAVLDLDSYSVGAFSRDDAVALHGALARLGLTHGPMPEIVEI